VIKICPRGLWTAPKILANITRHEMYTRFIKKYVSVLIRNTSRVDLAMSVCPDEISESKELECWD